MSPKIEKTDEEWRQELSPDEFRVLREEGTEPAFAGAYWDKHDEGIYRCRACKAELFRSYEKFDSGTGWPSFTDLPDRAAVTLHEDRSLFTRRTEVRCAACDSHLGHVFPDGPGPTGERFCINSCSLDFQSKEQ